jgi:hypothetical protein
LIFWVLWLADSIGFSTLKALLPALPPHSSRSLRLKLAGRGGKLIFSDRATQFE